MAGKTISLISLTSLLMACLFALSASFQLNDSVNGVGKSLKIIRSLAKFAFWLGLFLFVNVVFEDYQNGNSGFWSLDMKDRIVREKIGSGLVVCSMSLQLQAPVSRASAKHFEYGMATLVGIGYGLSIVFYLCHKKEMRF